MLSLEEGFAPQLVDTLLGHFSVVEPVETTTTALAEAGSVA
ncbi:hypothetical protein [Arthrobacter sp. NQ4]|nr:hypothetical protein [Arthrobacter sp. NQ4]MDE8588339.1 hypothetical protein [Arthrobacter sp. NQ4]